MNVLLAEQWFQALRLWRTRIIRVPRSRPWMPRGSVPLRRPGLCPVCRSGRVDKYDDLINYTIAAGKNLRKALRLIAEELGVGVYRVERHLRTCVARPQEAPARLIGEWVHGGIEYVETPAGWIPSGQVMAAIRASPESQLLLDAIRGGRKQTLLNKGYFRDEKSRRIGQALLQLDAYLRFSPVRGTVLVK